jgi:hypothetical protein
MVVASCILFYSLLNGIDPRITEAVISVESGGNPYALGKMGDSGLMQIRKRYVLESQSQLFQPCTNVRIGTQLLAKAKNACKKCVDVTWINCYNTGTHGCKRIKHKDRFPYYLKIKKVLNERINIKK